jgi:hypothetical protein
MKLYFFQHARARMADRVGLTERDIRLLGISAFWPKRGAGGGRSAAWHGALDHQSLQALEVRLGGTLCSPGPTGFRLTELGEKVLRAALTARDAILHAEDELAESMCALTGELALRIADHTISNPRMPDRGGHRPVPRRGAGGGDASFHPAAALTGRGHPDAAAGIRGRRGAGGALQAGGAAAV